MKKRGLVRTNFQPALISVIILIILLLGTINFTRQKRILWEKDIRANLFNLMSTKKSELEKALFSRIYYTRGIAAYVSLNPEITNSEYMELAKEYIRKDTVIGSMAISKDCILTAIYPLEGHEAALGLDLLSHPERKTIVEKTIQTHQTFVAGPVELVEGGLAFISYTPIFDKTGIEENRFWGVTDIVIKKSELLNEAGLKEIQDGYVFGMRGINGTGNNGDIFWGDSIVFDNNPVTVKIDLPIGEWILAAMPEGGWNQYKDQDKALLFVLVVSSFIISVLIWLFARAVVQIRYNEKELKAIFASMDSLIIEFGKNGDYRKIASHNSDLLYQPAEKLIGKNLSEVFDPEKSDFFKKAIRECLNKKSLVVIEYSLKTGGKERWFSARISYKSEDSIIFNAYDISEKKIQEKLLKESEQKLKQLNDTKDKFFSIIAHDLRGPLGSQKSVIDMILENYESLNESTRKDLLNTLKESSFHLYNLLESLLEWALSQSGKIEVNPQSFNVLEKYPAMFSHFLSEAKLKNIRFFNEISSSANVLADVTLTEIILRNLVSNAIKFTGEKGEVTIRSEEIENMGKKYLKINISDTGVGMSDEKIKTLFKPDKTRSSRGTANEKGNGLGLILCKEFAEKQGGQIAVQSTLGEGSIFSVILPKP